MHALVARVLADRGVDLPDGTAYRLMYVAPWVYAEYPEIVDTVRDRARRDVAQAAGVPAERVTLTEVTPDELDAAWRKHEPMEPPPIPLHALVAYNTRDADGIPLGEYTAVCGCRMRGRAMLTPCRMHDRVVRLSDGTFSIGPFTAPRERV